MVLAVLALAGGVGGIIVSDQFRATPVVSADVILITPREADDPGKAAIKAASLARREARRALDLEHGLVPLPRLTFEVIGATVRYYPIEGLTPEDLIDGIEYQA